MIIAFEGVDASGKSTQAARLAEEKGIDVLKFPDYKTPTGKKISQILQGEIHAGPGALQTLMTINRYEHLYRLQCAEVEAEDLICDRYSMSGIAYGMADGLGRWFLESINENLPKAFTIYIDIPVNLSFRRRPERADDYEASIDRLSKARRFYLEECCRWQNHAAIVDGVGTPDQVYERVLKALERVW